MFGFPASTNFDKRIPKQKFYENIDISPKLKKIFVDQIHFIYWRNKLAPTTLNIAKGVTVSEVEVFEVMLNTQKLDETVLRQIDKEIPYHILFILTCKDRAQAWIGYKEVAQYASYSYKGIQYYHTNWMPANELRFHIDGLNIDAVYENLFLQIAKNTINVNSEKSLKESVESHELQIKLMKQINILEKKIHQEKQLNRQLVLSAELKQQIKELEKLKCL